MLNNRAERRKTILRKKRRNSTIKGRKTKKKQGQNTKPRKSLKQKNTNTIQYKQNSQELATAI